MKQWHIIDFLISELLTFFYIFAILYDFILAKFGYVTKGVMEQKFCFLPW